VANAQLPAVQLHSLVPPGGRQGTEVSVRVAAGVDLDRVDRLLFSHPGITARVKPADPLLEGLPPEPTNEFLATIAAEVPPGVYDVRAAGLFGISNPRAFVVGDLPEQYEKADNHSLAAAMPVAVNTLVNGVVEAANVDYFRIDAPGGKRVLVEAWAERIDSRLEATMVLYDAAGRELARSHAAPGRDPLLDFTTAHDGAYTLAIQDAIYGGGAEYFYRLAIHTGPYLDFALPLAGRPGSRSEITLFGRNLPRGTPVPGMTVDGRPLERATVPVTFMPDLNTGGASSSLASQGATLDAFEFRYNFGGGASNPLLLGLTPDPVAVEQEPANNTAAGAQRLVVPCEIDGQFYPRGDLDWFTFDAKRGSAYTLEVISQRLGVGSDPQLLVQRVTRNDKGEEQVADVAEVDDDRELGGSDFSTASGDPVYRLNVPEDGTYRVLLRDLIDYHSDPRRVYRLAIHEPRPDFRLVAVPRVALTDERLRPTAATAPTSLLVRRGGTTALSVLALRRDGFSGPIEVAADGLPPGVTCDRVTIGPAQDGSVLVFHAAPDAAAWAGDIRIVGRAKIGNDTIERVARSGVTQWANSPMPAIAGNRRFAKGRVTFTTALAVSDQESLPLDIVLGERKAWDMSRAGKVEIPVKLSRGETLKEPVTVSLAGLPDSFKSSPATIAGDQSDAKLGIEIPPGAAVGPYSLYVQARTRVQYQRDPGGAAKLGEMRQTVEKLADELTKTAQQAEATKQQAAQAAVDAETRAKSCPEHERPAMASAAENATRAKADAEQRAAAMAAKAKRAAEVKTMVAKRADDAGKAAQPKEVQITVPSNVITLDVRPAPITTAVEPAECVVKRGQAGGATFRLARLYGFAEAVELVPAATGVAGLSIAVPAVAKDQLEAKITVAAAAETPPGNYTVTIAAKPKFNDQPLEVQQTFVVKVE
jgi:hypothetical protein